MSSGSRRARTSCWVIVDAPRSLVPGRVLGDGRDQGGRVDAGVVPERAVLGGRRGVEDQGRDVGVVDDAATLVLEPTELHLAVTVVHDRRLGEGQLAELARVGQARGEDAKRRDRHDPGQPDRHEGERQHGAKHRPEAATAGDGTGRRRASTSARRIATSARGPGHAGSPGRLGRPTAVSMCGCCGAGE